MAHIKPREDAAAAGKPELGWEAGTGPSCFVIKPPAQPRPQRCGSAYHLSSSFGKEETNYFDMQLLQLPTPVVDGQLPVLVP
jgi:hypothetical protein